MVEPHGNETDSKEDLGLIASEEKPDDVNESGNQSNPSSNDIPHQSSQTEAKKERKIIYAKKMEKFQTHGIGNNTNNIKYVKRKKRVTKIKGKRTANSTDYKLNQYASSNTSNNENITENNNIVFSPRGINPRGYSKSIKEIVIGVPRGGDGDYEEYDGDAEFNTNIQEQPKLIIAYEEPYKIMTEDDVNRYTNPDRIIENYLRTSKGTKRIYYIAAEEVQWDYSGRSIR